MRSLPVPRRLLLPFFIVWTTGRLAAVSVGFDLGADAQVAAAPGFGPKLQAGGSAAVVLFVPLTTWLDLTTSVELFGMLPSDTSGGFSYRGFGGGSLCAGFDLAWPIVASPSLGVLSLGGTVAAAAALPYYQYTRLYFFYPEVQLGALLAWRPARAQKWDFRLSLPVRMQFRRDMTYSLSAGLAFGASYYLGGSR